VYQTSTDRLPRLISLTWNGKEKKSAALLSAHSKETNLNMNLKLKGYVQEPISHLATGYDAKDGTEQTEIQNRYQFSLRPQRNRDGTCKMQPFSSLKGDGFFLNKWQTHKDKKRARARETEET